MNTMDINMEERLQELMQERVHMLPYDPRWSEMFEVERTFLENVFPTDLLQRIEHIGSTAVPGMSAKPTIDIQVEVNDLGRVREEVVPVLTGAGYEFIWRKSIGEQQPYYAWFIKRNANGKRTHHLHVVEPDSASLDRLIFRDHLRTHPHAVARYEALKKDLTLRYPNDRVAFTQGKTEFIATILAEAQGNAH